MSFERHIALSRGSLPSLDEGLAWAVQQYDKEFTQATMVKISIEQICYISGEMPEWRYAWTAAVSGLVEEDSGLEEEET